MRSVTVNLSGIQVSDLFFNSELPSYKAIHREAQKLAKYEPPTGEAVIEAVTTDARSFTYTLLGREDEGFASELVEDFMGRI
jgi:hypothetical protein